MKKNGIGNLIEKRNKNRRAMDRRINQRRLSGNKKKSSTKKGIFSLFNIFVAAIVCAGVSFGIYEGSVYAMTSPYFSVADIEINGNEEIEKKEILKVSGLHLGQNTFSLNLKESCLKLQNLTWIKDAFIERELPDKLIVTINERKPYIVARSKALYLVDREGIILKELEKNEEHGFPTISVSSGELTNDEITLMPTPFNVVKDLLNTAHNSSFLKSRGIKEILVGKGNKVTVHTRKGSTPFYFNRFDFVDGVKKLDAMEGLLLGKSVKILDLSYRHQVVVTFMCDTGSKQCQDDYNI